MTIVERILSIESRIAQAAQKAGREIDSVNLVAVSKHQPLEIVQQYCGFQNYRAKAVIFGENYVQEFRDKKSELTGQFKAHLIGPLQRNKVKQAIGLFDLIQSVDSERLLKEIDKEAAKIQKIQSVFLQINVSKDPAKSGFLSEAIDESLLRRLSAFTSIRIEGLMTITQLYQDSEQARKDFRTLRNLGTEVQKLLSLPFCCLSMGMSDDFEVAIEEGASHVRIGTALFGERVTSAVS